MRMRGEPGDALVRSVKVAGGLKVGHFIGASVEIGLLANRLKSRPNRTARWKPGAGPSKDENTLVQIES